MKLEFESNTSTVPHFGNGYITNSGLETKAVQIPQILQAGIKAAQAGNRNEARQMLIQVTEAEPDNETAWLWMASISEYPEELIIFLNNVLSINPKNARALEWMRATKTLLAETFVQRGVDAASDANMDFARQCFLQAIVHDAESEAAWFRLASISDAADEKIAHLQKVLNINPLNENAKTLIETAKTQVAETVLRKANSAAVAGERETARTLLQEVFQHAPEMEAAWILNAYLADTFSEKITCFEKVLTLNPENEMAMSGLGSLRAMMAKTEAKKAEQAARIAEMEKIIEAEEVLIVTEDQIVYADDEDESRPTQELEYPTALAGDSDEFKNQTLNERFQPADAPAFNQTEETYDDSHQQEREISPPPVSGENVVADFVSAQPNFMNQNQLNKYSSAPSEMAQNELLDNQEETPFNGFANTISESRKEFSPATDGNIGGENPSKSVPDMTACPFCSAENEANAFVCASCRTILTLSDLEMLLAYTEADREVLSSAIERMELEKSERSFSSPEALKNLGIGQINLKNLRLGVSYLQKAAQMNPNDVVLGSKVNILKIRLSEIEQQESQNSQLTKGRKILVVDDSATVRKLISSKLEKSGHEVVTATDGIDALEQIKEFMPDLILLDIMMPQLDGYQVCKLIRTNELTKDVPVVMISGKDGFFDKVRGRMAGTTGYITKPFGPETLMKTVETYISQRGAMMLDESEMEN